MKRLALVIAVAAAFLAGCAHRAPSQNQMTSPDQELAGKLYAAIWFDLQSNALIGNGNELAAQWANAGDDTRQLHIENLQCTGGPTELRCQFGLLRDGGIAPYLGQPVPDRLTCGTRFRRVNDEWSIPRLPPGPEGGHSRITIRCQPA